MATTKPLKQFRFVIRKYVVASSVQEALKYEHKAPVHEIYVADKQNDPDPAPAIGFEYQTPQE